MLTNHLKCAWKCEFVCQSLFSWQLILMLACLSLPAMSLGDQKVILWKLRSDLCVQRPWATANWEMRKDYQRQADVIWIRFSWIKSTGREAEGRTYLTSSRVELHWNSHIDSLRSYWSIVCFLPRCHKTCCSVKNAKRFLNQHSPILLPQTQRETVAIWQYERAATAGPLQLDDDSGTWIIDASANLAGRHIQTRGCWTAKLHRPFWNQFLKSFICRQIDPPGRPMND